MIIIKSPREISLLRDAGRIVAETHELLKEHVKPGISTYELDRIAYKYITGCKATPSFLNYQGFPGSICASVNDKIVHGIPSKHEILKEGDIISLDIGAYYKGYHGDMARTLPVGEISEEDQKLIDVTAESFQKGFEQAVLGNHLSDISHAVQVCAESAGFSVVREYVGHGVGTKLHEDPPVPNYGPPHHGPRLVEGLVIAVEPMINQGTYHINVSEDGWTVSTADGKKSSHHENTFAVTKNGPVILTAV